PGHSTETAPLKLMNDVLHALDNGDVSLLTLLDLSAAFDTIDHNILLQRLEHLYGISGTPLNWFRSYLSNRTQTVIINNKLSQPSMLNFGVPQGSVLGPILFILYTKPLTTLIRQHSIANQSFADDTQLYNSWRPDQIDASVQSMQDCISDVKTRMTAIKLKLNDDKTEPLLTASN
uniref:reverse transcriptase domain-containing protein n=1 Tax=Thiolapillus sp. TaxID=2017437 RepID=UPI003AF500BA